MVLDYEFNKSRVLSGDIFGPFCQHWQRSGLKSKFIWSQFTISGLQYQWYMIKRKFLGILKLYKTKKWLQDNLSWFEFYQSSLNILVLVATLRTKLCPERENCFWIFMILMDFNEPISLVHEELKPFKFKICDNASSKWQHFFQRTKSMDR